MPHDPDVLPRRFSPRSQLGDLRQARLRLQLATLAVEEAMTAPSYDAIGLALENIWAAQDKLETLTLERAHE